MWILLWALIGSQGPGQTLAFHTQRECLARINIQRVLIEESGKHPTMMLCEKENER